MDFIEKIFGVSPDGGSGSLEFALFVVPVVILAMVIIWRRKRNTL
ncbi:hypothetical protein BH10PSE7_BH10PSE7_34170 [soil metagenome]